jgi:hypothetical protein
MALRIQPYTEELIGEVQAFNTRLAQGGAGFGFPEVHISGRLPKALNDRLYEEYLLAVEDETRVRGAYILKHQEFVLHGEPAEVGNIQLPLSEGIVNKAHAAVGMRLIMDALKKYPALYALGMGGEGQPLPLLLKSMGWKLLTLTFLFKVIRPFTFLRNINLLRRKPSRRAVLDVLAFTGLGGVAVRLVQAQRSLPYARARQKISWEVQARFGSWADDFWEEVKSASSLCAVRKMSTLNTLYPEVEPRFTRLKVLRNSVLCGWAVVSDVIGGSRDYFGNMRVGTLVDCLALTGQELAVVHAATCHLSRAGMDLVVSNQAHHAYTTALRQNGYLSGPSNFVLGMSKKLVERIRERDPEFRHVHMTRGDGDGPFG